MTNRSYFSLYHKQQVTISTRPVNCTIGSSVIITEYHYLRKHRLSVGDHVLNFDVHLINGFASNVRNCLVSLFILVETVGQIYGGIVAIAVGTHDIAFAAVWPYR